MALSGRTTQSHRLSGDMDTARAPSLENAAGTSNFVIRKVPLSSLFRRRTEKTLTAETVATIRIFPSAESIADVIFSSPCDKAIGHDLAACHFIKDMFAFSPELRPFRQADASALPSYRVER